jgi:hypothetical protein
VHGRQPQAGTPTHSSEPGTVLDHHFETARAAEALAGHADRYPDADRLRLASLLDALDASTGNSEDQLVQLLREFEEHDGTAIHVVCLPER